MTINADQALQTYRAIRYLRKASDDALNKRFYERESFQPFPDRLMKLFLPMSTIAELFG